MRPEQFSVVIASATREGSGPVGEILRAAGFTCHLVEIGLDGLSRVAEIKPKAFVLSDLSEPMQDWVLHFVEGNPEPPAIVALGEASQLEDAPDWLYDVVGKDELEQALVHRLTRALAFEDMRRLSVRRAEELGHSGAQLRMVSMIDVVTGLFNRRYFRKHLRESYAAARRYKRPLTCLLMRIETYRNLLERWGTEGTNDILDSVALAITKVIREADIAARIDDDLFAFLLPETTGEGAGGLAHRLLTRLRTTKYPNDADVRVVSAHVELNQTHADGTALLEAALAELPG